LRTSTIRTYLILTDVICLYREKCHRDWLRMRKTPLFGCICPQNQMKKRCDRIFSLINENPCISKYIYGGFMIFVVFVTTKNTNVTSHVYYFVDRVKHIGANLAIYYIGYTRLYSTRYEIYFGLQPYFESRNPSGQRKNIAHVLRKNGFRLFSICNKT